jgi:hypothetical protein
MFCLITSTFHFTLESADRMGCNKQIARKAKGRKKEKKVVLKDSCSLKCRLKLQFYLCNRGFGEGGSRSRSRSRGR